MHEAVPGDRERRARATRASRADGPLTETSAIDAALAGADKLRLRFGHISDAVFATDATNRITHWTDSAERLFGYSSAEAVGRPFDELLPCRMAQTSDQGEFLITLESGRTWRGRGTVRVRDGREIWLESMVEPIMADGRLLGSVSVARDVTATVEAQQKLADEERFVEAVLGGTEALVVVLDPQGRLVRFNGACERLSGYRTAEIVGRPLWDVVIPSAEAEDVRAAVADLQAGAFPNSHENHWLTRTGELRLISWENTCLTDDRGAVTHVIATGIDVTERKQAEEALRHEQYLMHALMENIPSQMYFKDHESRFTRISNAQARTLGLSDPGQAVGMTDFDFFTNEHAQQAYEDEREVIRTGRTFSSEEKETRAGLPDRWVSTTKLPLRDADERIVGTYGISTDITDRRNAEEALRDRVRQFTALAEFAAAVNAIREPGRLAAALVDAASAVVPSDTVVITMLDRGDGRYRVRYARGLGPGAVGVIIQPGEGTAGRAITERTVILREHKPGDQYSAALRDYQLRDTSWALGVPLINEDTVLGVISVGRFDTDTIFTQAEIEVFGLLGSHAALALASAYLVEDVSALAIHDALTGLYNRRHFDAALDLAIARFKRNAPAGSLAAIMFDLDHFGAFNKHHGHLAGDALLRLFGKILRERLRSADIVARYGGEEFVAILENCGLPEAARLADEVRRELEARSVPSADGRPLRATVSAGCAVLYASDPTREALLGRADAGLYMAKEAGRNRVVTA